ncbi:MAG: TGS domain-containing protein [Deltaproteobacteria bacterium]|nr:TGS domain-containing protein [Deltaproteobacteria bacterium]
MPANLPQIYLDAEKRYREARTPEEKIAALEEMLAIIPKHKGTDKLQADLKHRISKHREQSQKKKGAAVSKSIYHIDREGAAQAIIIGPPNTGKSSLVESLTKASPEVAEFPHTTHKPTPGMALYEDIQFQLIDTPPISHEYMDPEMADMIRRGDIIIIMLDLKADLIGQYEDTLSLLASLRIFPEGTDIPDDVRRPCFPKKILVVVNKMDNEKDREDFAVFKELTGIKLPAVGISILQGNNIQEFLQALYTVSNIIRVYSKTPGKDPDMKEPFVIRKDSTLEDLAAKIHKDIAQKLKFARIWGKAVHDGQMVQRDYIMNDGDIVEIHL